MARRLRLVILSDIHYAAAAEQARGNNYEYRHLPNPLLRFAIRNYRHYIWMRHPLRQNHLLDAFLDQAQAGPADHVIANGDYSCDSAFIGVSDAAACQSARECLDKLRRKFSPNFHAVLGDHELGKFSFFGGIGGLRLASWQRATGELALQPFWRLDLGRYVLLGVTSTLIALPIFESEALADELPEWRRLRDQHLDQIRAAFASLQPDQRLLLFCHDPTALPFLGRDDTIRAKLPQLEHTIIGHLHSNLVLWKSRLLAGIPPVFFLGHTAKRLTTALSQGRHWKPFHVKLCPALAGIQLLKDGGFHTLHLDPEARHPAQFQFHPLPQ